MSLLNGWFADRAPKLRGVGSGYVPPFSTPRFFAPVFTADNIPEQFISSTDGITWRYHSAPDNRTQYRMAARGANAWVVVSENFSVTSPIFARTVNNATFADVTNPAFHTGAWALAYGNATFVLGGYNASNVGKFLYSIDDGLTWTVTTRGDDRTLCYVAYGNSIFLSVTSSDVQVVGSSLVVTTSPVAASKQTSADGITWGSVSSPASLQNVTTTTGAAGNWIRLRYLSDGLFWLVGWEPPHGVTAGRCLLAHSTNGAVWTTIDTLVPATTSPAVFPMDIAYDGSSHYVVACRDNKVLISSNGTTWTSVDPGPTTRWKSVVYAAGKFVIVGEDLFVGTYDNQVIGYSTDNGATWTIVNAPIGPGTGVGTGILNFQDISYG